MRFFALILGAALLFSSSAHADESPIAWQPSWDRPSTPEYLFSGALAATLIAGYYGFPTPAPGIPGGILFDDAARELFRADSSSTRLRAGELSDVGQAVLIGYPLLVDTALFSWAIHGDRDVAWWMFVIDAQSFLLTTALTLMAKNLTTRERPYVAECRDDPTSPCGSNGRNKSFFSGHAAAAFTGAGLICAHHEALPIYGGGAGDASACVGAVALAMATGVLRMTSDDHYATDVLAGAVVGILSGYVLPRLAYYHRREPARRDASSLRAAAVPDLGPDRVGLTIVVAY